MSSAVGVPLAARFTPVRELATLRRGLSAQSRGDETAPWLVPPPTAFRLIFGGREADTIVCFHTRNLE
ncbi:hypothetical protein D8911_13615 [Levilactobacillus brevis]|nr:hypothetical protein D8911_13615 [Levilactobacillus brevis]